MILRLNIAIFKFGTLYAKFLSFYGSQWVSTNDVTYTAAFHEIEYTLTLIGDSREGERR